MINSNEKNIKLIELGNTWQGEGPDTGRQMVLSRFKKCNKKCPFCDTSIRMHTAFEGSYSIDDINQALENSRGLMITGGEPTLKDDNFNQTILMIQYCNYEVCNIETNGCSLSNMSYLTKENNKIKFIYSPKFFTNDEYLENIKIFDSIINDERIFFKIVVTDSIYIEKYLKLLNERNISRNRIYLMPEGTTKEQIDQNWDKCIEMSDKYKCNISSRLHIVHGFI